MAQAIAAELRSKGEDVTLDRRVNADVAAEILQRSWQTLKRWRAEGEGPRYFTIGNRPTYRIDDLLAYIELGASRPGAQKGSLGSGAQSAKREHWTHGKR